MTRLQDMEYIAARVELLREVRDRELAAEHAAIRVEWDAASIGPPKPVPPGMNRTHDWGLRALREKCFWELRRRRAAAQGTTQ